MQSDEKNTKIFQERTKQIKRREPITFICYTAEETKIVITPDRIK